MKALLEHLQFRTQRRQKMSELDFELPPLFGIQSDINRTMDNMVRAKIESMPADKVKALILDLVGKNTISGLAEPLGVEALVAQQLRATLESL